MTPPRAARGDHPRVCGEQPAIPAQPLTVSGSSPRVRGAGPAVHDLAGLLGIIPACAGSRRKHRDRPYRRRDHPRVCGEQVTNAIADGTITGSSPRVRGAVIRLHAQLRPYGIIPACAGSRPQIVGRRCRDRDHPRVCGEQGHVDVDSQGRAGSSPRVRGAVIRFVMLAYIGGIIPACAGSR